MAKPEKTTVVAEIAERFKAAEAALLTEYRGLRVADMAELRRSLREAGADYKVLKNTLARIAVKEVGLEDLTEMLVGPTAIVFVNGDLVEAAKALDDASKKFPVLIVKGGALKGGKMISADEAKALAKLESREVLLTKVAMMMNQPAQMAVNAFAALLRDLGSMLAQVLAQKEAEAPEAEAATPEPVAEAATPEPQAAAASDTGAEAPEAEEVGQPSPEGDSPEEQAESAEEPPAVPEAAATSDENTDDEEAKEEE